MMVISGLSHGAGYFQPLNFGARKPAKANNPDDRRLDQRSRDFWASTPEEYSATSFLPVLLAYLPNKQSKILDIGCGWGKTVQQLHSAGYRQAQGIDFNPEAVRQAAALGLGRKVRRGDALDLPKSMSGRFDAVILQTTLSSLPSREAIGKALASASHVLKPKGKIFIIDWALDTQRYQAQYEQGVKAGHSRGTFEVSHPKTGQFLFLSHHLDNKTLKCLLRETGFNLPPLHHEQTVTKLTKFDRELLTHILAAEKAEK